MPAGARTLEQIWRGILRAPLRVRQTQQSIANQFAGWLAVASGIATATVSTTSVRSDSIVLLSAFSNVGSNATQAIRVSSLADRAYFGVQVNPAPVGTDFNIAWMIVNQQ